MSVFTKIVALADKCRDADGSIKTVEFLETCRQVIPVIGKGIAHLDGCFLEVHQVPHRVNGTVPARGLCMS
jgi:hypothetical protein